LAFCFSNCTIEFHFILELSSFNAADIQEVFAVLNADFKSVAFTFLTAFPHFIVLANHNHPIKASHSSFSFSLCKLSLISDSQGI
jgi:hypothetical protein